MPNETRNIVIVQGHPDPQGNHFDHALADAYTLGAREAGHDLQPISVAQLDFPLLRSREDQRAAPPCARCTCSASRAGSIETTRRNGATTTRLQPVTTENGG